MDKGYKLSISSSSLNDALLSAENTMGGNMAVKTELDGRTPDRFGILKKDGLEPGYYKLGLRYFLNSIYDEIPEKGGKFSFENLKNSNKITAISCTLFSSDSSAGIYSVSDATGLFSSNIKVAGKDKFTQNTELLIQSIYGIATVVERPADRSTPTKFVYLIDNEEIEVAEEDLNNKDKLIKILVGTNASKFEEILDISAYSNLREIHLPKTLEEINIKFRSSVEDLSNISGTVLTDGINIVYSGSEFEFNKFYRGPVDPFIIHQYSDLGIVPIELTFLNN